MRTQTGRMDMPVLIIGAGPVGLAAAAHLSREGQSFLVLEAGAHAGDAVCRWGHVRLFTPWRYLVDQSARVLLQASGWLMPDPDGVPTGTELVDAYLTPLAELPQIAAHVRYRTRVASVSRRGLDKAKTVGRGHVPFDVRAVATDGTEVRFLARAVIDASGTYASPNPLGANGAPAIGEQGSARAIYYGIPDVLGTQRSRYEGRKVAVVGSGHSAFNVLLDLESLLGTGTEITWVVRSQDLSRLWGGGEADQLTGRGQLGLRMRALAESGRLEVVAGFATEAVRQRDERTVLVALDGRESGAFDEVIAVTGFRPDPSLTRELRLDLDTIVEAPSALAPLIDPNVHSCGTVPPHGYRELAHPERDYYAVGMKSYGRAPTFLMLTGYEQVRSVVKALVGDLDAAGRVELCLPETGVCDTGLVPAGVAAAEHSTAVKTDCCGR